MIMWMLPFAVIGAIVILFYFCFCGIDSCRQAFSPNCDSGRKTLQFKRKPSFREIMYAFRREFMSGYDSLEIAFIIIPAQSIGTPSQTVYLLIAACRTQLRLSNGMTLGFGPKDRGSIHEREGFILYNGSANIRKSC